MSRANTNLRTIKCAICDTLFEATHSRAKYCSDGCRRIGVRKSWVRYGEKNRPVRRDYSKQHYAANREAISERITAYQASEAGKRAMKISDARQREKYPEKYAARQAVHSALQKGELVRQPCRCGALKTQAHHPDYAKPLDVVWLCSPCHRAEHRAERAAA